MACTWRVGVIGSTQRGDYGHGLDTVWLAVPEAKIVGVADDNAEGLAAAAQRLGTDQAFADYRHLLDKIRPDVVSICPRWLDRHAEMAVAAAERGIHVYMEKPFCRTPAEADAIVTACQKTHTRLAIAHQTRYSPKLEVVRELISGGRIGDVLEFRTRGKEDSRGGGEDLWVLGSHVLNLVHTLGGDADWCCAQVCNSGEPVTAEGVHDGPEGIGPLVGDQVQAVYGLSASRTAYFGSRKNAGLRGSRFAVQILGTDGIIEIQTGILPSVKLLEDPTWSPGRSSTVWKDVSSQGVGSDEPLTSDSLAGGNGPAVKDLLAAIEESREPLCGPEDGRHVVELISAVFASARSGQTVRIPLASRENPLAGWSAGG